MTSIFDLNKDHYTVLGISRFATQEQIKKAFKKLAIIYHPDKNIERQVDSVQCFRRICEAYQTLIDSQKRRDYDNSVYKVTCSNYPTFKKHGNDSEEYIKNLYRNATYRYYSKGQDMLDSILKGKNVYKKLNSPHITRSQPQSFRYFSNISTNTQISPELSQNLPSYSNYQQILKSISILTRIINGKIVTIKKTIIKKKDGTKEIIQQQCYEQQTINKEYSQCF